METNEKYWGDDPYIGEIRMWPGYFAPLYWMFCEGQLLPISEYDTLFSVIGTKYGGDGVQTFALPDLRGRIPVGTGTGASGSVYALGQVGGAETFAVTQDVAGSVKQVAPAVALRTYSSETTAESLPPFLGVHFIISLFGIYPTQS